MRILIVAALISASLACTGGTPRSDGGPNGDGRLPAPTKNDASTGPQPDAGLQTPDALL